MSRRLALATSLALGLLAAVPARADKAADYAAAWRLLGPMVLARDPDAQIASVEAMIGALRGRWYFLQTLAGDGPEMPSDDIIAKACERLGVALVPIDRLSFETRLTHKYGVMVTRYVYAGNGVFVASTPISQTLSRLFGDKLAEAKSQQMLAMLRLGVRNGIVSLLMPSPDLLVLMPIGGGAEIWGRCPG